MKQENEKKYGFTFTRSNGAISKNVEKGEAKLFTDENGNLVNPNQIIGNPVTITYCKDGTLNSISGVTKREYCDGSISKPSNNEAKEFVNSFSEKAQQIMIISLLFVTIIVLNYILKNGPDSFLNIINFIKNNLLPF